MCVFNITIDEPLLTQIRPVFKDNDTMGEWMQQYVEQMVVQMAQQINNGTEPEQLMWLLGKSEERALEGHVVPNEEVMKRLDNYVYGNSLV